MSSTASPPVATSSEEVVASFATDTTRRARFLRTALVLAGLLLPQVFLYWPSLLGQTYLLPLDNLTRPNMYTPLAPEQRKAVGYEVQNSLLDDLILAIEFRRLYAVQRVRNGELPLWTPYLFCGAPFLATNNAAVFSPFRVIDYLINSPVSHAWSHLAKALWMGVGAYLFLRKAVNLSFWAAAIGAWSFPLATYFIFWQGYPPSYTAGWLPWVLLANYTIVSRPAGWGTIGLTLATTGMLVSGHAGSATHVLLVSGFYALWSIARHHGRRALLTRAAWGALGGTIIGWGLAFLLTAPQNLATVDYLKRSQRVESRAEGTVEFLPMGLMALPQYVLPYTYGCSLRHSIFIVEGKHNWFESAAQGSAGLLMALVFVPFAFADRSRRADLVFWIFVALLGSAHILDVPILASFLRIPPLHLLQNNRFAFATAWAIIVLGAMGINVLCTRPIRPNRWMALPIALLLIVGAYCTYRYYVPPELLRRLVANLSDSPATLGFRNNVLSMFRWFHLNGMILCSVALLLWFIISKSIIERRWLPWYLSVIIVGELVWNAYGVNAQCDPKLYYPEIPSLRAIAEGPPGRITGVNCLLPNLGISHRLHHVRGYDGAYPSRMYDLFIRSQEPGREIKNIYHPHLVMIMTPAEDSPILDMLNLRYRIYRGSPPAGVEPWHHSLDYWVKYNENALPRCYVPRRVEVVTDHQQRLDLLSSDDFDAREIAYVEEPLAQPITDAQGTVNLIADQPERVVLEANMETPGLVVLADLWYPAWKAYLNDAPVPIHHTNHALRGIEVPAGKSTIEFRYEAGPLFLGFRIAAAGLAVLAAWSVGVVWFARRRQPMNHDNTAANPY